MAEAPLVRDFHYAIQIEHQLYAIAPLKPNFSNSSSQTAHGIRYRGTSIARAASRCESQRDVRLAGKSRKTMSISPRPRANPIHRVRR